MAAAVTVDVFTSTGLDGRASYAPETTEQLWRQVPAELRLERFTPETVPAEHLPAFAGGGRFAALDLTMLPLGLRRELASSVADIIARGGLIPSARWRCSPATCRLCWRICNAAASTPAR